MVGAARITNAPRNATNNVIAPTAMSHAKSFSHANILVSDYAEKFVLLFAASVTKRSSPSLYSTAMKKMKMLGNLNKLFAQLYELTEFWYRFIYLEDCGHSIEIDGMDHWMGMDDENSKEIQMKRCPRCKTIIRSCYRYGDIIKQNFQEIVRVKQLLLASVSNPRDFSIKIEAKIVKAATSNHQLTKELNYDVSRVLALGLEAIQSSLAPRRVKNKLEFPSLHTDQRHLYEVQLDLTERILDVMKNTPKVLPPNQSIGGVVHNLQFLTTPVKMKPNFVLDILNRAQRLIDLLFNRDRFPNEQYQSFIAEIERLDLVRAYYMLQSAHTYAGNASRLPAERKILGDLLVKSVKKLSHHEKKKGDDCITNNGKDFKHWLGHQRRRTSTNYSRCWIEARTLVSLRVFFSFVVDITSFYYLLLLTFD